MVAMYTAKEDATLAELISSGGARADDVSNVIIQRALEEANLVKGVRVELMTANTARIGRMAFSGQRMLKPAPRGTAYNDDGSNDRALKKAQRTKTIVDAIELNAAEFVGEVALPFEVIAEAIGDGALEDEVYKRIGMVTGGDMQDYLLNSSKASTDPELSSLNGWKVGCGIEIDAEGAPLSYELFERAMAALPDRFSKKADQLRFLTSYGNMLAYRKILAQRNTALGDAAVSSKLDLSALGVPLEQTASMGSSDIILTHPLNLVAGIRKNPEIHREVDYRSRQVNLIVHNAFAAALEEAEAAVRIKNIGAPAA